jgi:hypothetical protein
VDFPANGRWTIYSVQKTLPLLGRVGAVFGAHNYLALVNPRGVVDSEMQGVYTGPDFVMNGPVPGNYLNVRMYRRGGYIPNQSILSAKAVFVGDEDDLRSLLYAGYRSVAEALDSTRMLYDGAEIFGHAVNSNSVWYTALRAMGVEDPSQFDGWGSTPGNRIDLREEPSNNQSISACEQPWVPNPAFTSLFPIEPDEEVALPLSEPAPNELNSAIEEEQDQLRQQLQDIEAILDAIDDGAFSTDRDVIDGFLDNLSTQLDSLGTLNGTALLDRLTNLVDRLNEWRDYLQGQLDANAPSEDADDRRVDEEEPPSSFYQDDESEPEPDYAWADPPPPSEEDERD